MRYSFGKHEKLTHKNLIGDIFSKGKAITAYPLRLVYMPYEFIIDTPGQVVFGVPKKKVKKAVTRNRIKRQLREVSRLNKHIIYNCNSKTYAMAMLYLKSEPVEYQELESQFKEILNQFINREKK
jgi:ribonuclease P protein component